MLINPTYGAGGAQSSGYVEDGAQFLMSALSEYTFTGGYEYAPSAFTIEDGITFEVCGSINQAPGGYIDFFSASGIHLSTRVDTSVPASSDFGFVCWVSGYGAYELFVYPEQMELGDMHTFTLVQDMQTTSLYIDGELAGSTACQIASQQISSVNIFQRYNDHKPLWSSARIYTRALTAAEIAANHANDIAKYGGNS